MHLARHRTDLELSQKGSSPLTDLLIQMFDQISVNINKCRCRSYYDAIIRVLTIFFFIT